MNYHVKEFIENNIELIEQKDFYHLYSNWYNNAIQFMEDQPLIDELNDILYETGITNSVTTYDAKKQVLSEALMKIFTEWVASAVVFAVDDYWGKSPYFVERRYIADYLNSDLGLDLQAHIYPIMDDIAETQGLIIDNKSDGYRLGR